MSGGWTPGPWVLSRENSVCAQIDGEHHAVCTDQFCYAPQLEKDANAHLIAAAPCLYQALEMAKIWLEYDGRFDMQGINAALAKARGEA